MEEILELLSELGVTGVRKLHTSTGFDYILFSPAGQNACWCITIDQNEASRSSFKFQMYEDEQCLVETDVWRTLLRS